MSASQGLISFANLGLKLDSEKDVTEIVEKLKKENAVSCLDISGNTLGIPAAEIIGLVLGDLGSLQRCIFSDLFTGRLKSEIAPALQHLSTGIMASGANLVELDLSDNAFGPNGVVGVVDLLSSPACFSLKVLRMNNQGLGHDGCRFLAQALRKGRVASNRRGLLLRVFHGGRNRLENVGAEMLSEVFADMGSLEELSLYQNGIGIHGVDGIHSLVHLLKHNTNIRILNLSDNNITPTGCKVFAKALKSLDKLQELYLSDCILRPSGIQALAATFEDPDVTPCLRVLNVTGNEISRNAGVSLVISLGGKLNLELLDLNANEFGQSGILDIIHTLRSVGLLHVLPTRDNTSESEEAVGDHSFVCAFDDDQGSASEEDDEEEDSLGNTSASKYENGVEFDYDDDGGGEGDEPTEDSFNTVEERPLSTSGKNFSFREVRAALDVEANKTSPKSHDLLKPGPFGGGLFSILAKDSTDAATMRSKLWSPTCADVSQRISDEPIRPKANSLFSSSFFSATVASNLTNPITATTVATQLQMCLSDESNNTAFAQLTDLLKNAGPMNDILPHSKIRSLTKSASPEDVVRLCLRLSRTLPHALPSSNASGLEHVALGLLASVLVPTFLDQGDSGLNNNLTGRAVNCLLVYLGAIKAEPGSADEAHLTSLKNSPEKERCHFQYLRITRQLTQTYGKQLSPDILNTLALLLSEQKSKETSYPPLGSGEVVRLRDDILTALESQLSTLHI